MTAIFKDMFKGAVLGLAQLWLFAVSANDDDWTSTAATLALVLLPAGVLVYLARPTRSSLSLPGRWAATLEAVDQALRLNQPVQPFLEAAEEYESFGARRQLRAVRQRLDEGDSIATAVRTAAPDLPKRSAALLGTAERNGQLPATVRRLLAESRPGGEPGALAVVRLYPAMVVMMIVFVGGMCDALFVPKFGQIFHDFRGPVPRVVRVLDGAATVLGNPLVLGAAIVGWVAAAGLKYFGFSVPNPFTRDRAMGDACGVIADDLTARLPMPTALAEAAALPIGRRLKGRLRQWAAALEAGRPAAAAARAAGMPGLVVGFTTGTGAEEQARAFRFLAGYYIDRQARRGQLARRLGVPILVLGLGAAVAFVALTVFVPLARLIDLSNPYRGMP